MQRNIFKEYPGYFENDGLEPVKIEQMTHIFMMPIIGLVFSVLIILGELAYKVKLIHKIKRQWIRCWKLFRRKLRAVRVKYVKKFNSFKDEIKKKLFKRKITPSDQV